MKDYLKGFMTAVILFAVAGFTAGVVANDDTRQFVNEAFTNFVKDNCDVDVGYGYMTAGRTCRFGRVMTGFDGQSIYCSDVRVSCNLTSEE